MAKKYVLIVDDDPDLVETVAMLLESKGYEVGKAYDGIEGEESIKKRRPDVVVLDVMMPRKDGYKLCKELKSQQVDPGHPRHPPHRGGRGGVHHHLYPRRGHVHRGRGFHPQAGGCQDPGGGGGAAPVISWSLSAAHANQPSPGKGSCRSCPGKIFFRPGVAPGHRARSGYQWAGISRYEAPGGGTEGHRGRRLPGLVLPQGGDSVWAPRSPNPWPKTKSTSPSSPMLPGTAPRSASPRPKGKPPWPA